MILFVAEKPSFGETLAKLLHTTQGNKDLGYFYNDKYIVTWCLGHLVKMATPDAMDPKYKEWKAEDLPILPNHFMMQVAQKTVAQYRIVKELLNRVDVDEVVNATDAEREGELIFRNMYDAAHCKKNATRVWCQSQSDSAVLESIKTRKPLAVYEKVYQCALARAQADWLLGLNMTRIYSALSGNTYPVGRVQTVILSMIVERDHFILNFVPQPYYTVTASDSEMSLSWHDADNNRKFDVRKDAEAIVSKIAGKTGKFTTVKSEHKSYAHPVLYYTNSLQVDAGKKYKFTSDEISEALQSLYERHKLISYPRTDYKCIPEDMPPIYEKALTELAQVFPNADKAMDVLQNSGMRFDKTVANNAEVGDHYALIAQGENLLTFDYSKLNRAELTIFKMIIARMFAAVAPECQYDKLYLEATVEGETFDSTQTSITNKGYLAAEEAILGSSHKIKSITMRKEGDLFIAEQAEVEDKMTVPPKYYTDGAVIEIMGNISRYVEQKYKKILKDCKGLGAASTQAEIVKTLLKSKYIYRDGKDFIKATPKGIKLISMVDEALKTPIRTAEMESKLNKIRDGEYTRTAYVDEVKAEVIELVDRVKHAGIQKEPREESFDKTPIGICPRCHKHIYEGEKSYFCEGYKDDSCHFSIWKDNKLLASQKKKLTTTIVKALLKGPYHMTGLYSAKKKKTYDADLILDDTGTFVNITFLSKDNTDKPSVSVENKVIGLCPRCKKNNVVERQKSYSCEGYKDNSCAFTIWKENRDINGKTISTAQAKQLISGKPIVIKGYKNRNGKILDTKFVLEDTGTYANLKFAK